MVRGLSGCSGAFGMSRPSWLAVTVLLRRAEYYSDGRNSQCRHRAPLIDAVPNCCGSKAAEIVLLFAMPQEHPRATTSRGGARLRDILLRALEVRSEVYLWNSEHSLALRTAKDLIALEPFRESGHRLVMRAHAAPGNSAEALRAYERCRKLIARELGVDPSPTTKAVYESVLQSL